MRKKDKKQILELIHTLEEANEQLAASLKSISDEELSGVLAEEQSAAIAIGNRIDELEGEGGKAVHILEKYCEVLWQMNGEKVIPERKQKLKQLQKLITQEKKEINGFHTTFDIVFLPYKASMWDGMESVWKAALEDPDCKAYVMPIPYFDIKDGQVTEWHYEGERFPSYVPIVSFREVNLEELHPEIIFVHNPFDDWNRVTSVLPQFYSGRLKECAERLVYIPYYVTGEAVYATHRYLPSYQNMDFIVTQCEKMIDSYAAELPRKKFIPAGSPIADRIIHLEEHKPSIPEEWLPMLPNGRDFGGCRTLMLNTSISLLTQQGERFLDKLEYILRLSERMENILIIWRPHPLLHTAAESLGEKVADRLKQLEEFFLREKLGVLDRTPDVGVTMALCDAYLGEVNSSVIHMFGIAGKPRFYINLLIPRSSEKETDREYTVSGSCCLGDTEYLLLEELGWVISRDIKTGRELPLVRLPGREYVNGKAYRGMELCDRRLTIYPENETGCFSYQLDSGRLEKSFDRKIPSTEGNQTECVTRISAKCEAAIRAEWFQRGNLTHEWWEDRERTLKDYFYFLQTADAGEMTGYRGNYPLWLASLDGSCGRKVLQTVKESLQEEL